MRRKGSLPKRGCALVIRTSVRPSLHTLEDRARSLDCFCGAFTRVPTDELEFQHLQSHGVGSEAEPGGWSITGRTRHVDVLLNFGEEDRGYGSSAQERCGEYTRK